MRNVDSLVESLIESMLETILELAERIRKMDEEEFEQWKQRWKQQLKHAPAQQFYTLKEVASMLRLSERTIFRYIHSGRIKAVKTGKKWIIPREEIEKITLGR